MIRVGVSQARSYMQPRPITQLPSNRLLDKAKYTVIAVRIHPVGIRKGLTKSVNSIEERRTEPPDNTVMGNSRVHELSELMRCTR